MKKLTTVELEQCSLYDLPDDLAGVIAFLQRKQNSIPEEYRASAEFSIEKEYEYGDDCSIKVSVTYRRPETDEEQQTREREEQRRTDATAARELEQLARLKAKYGH